MRYETIDNTLFINNRKRLAEKLKSKAIAVLNANDTMPTSADGAFPFKQNTDLFYLTGIEQEETILLLCPEASDNRYREILFIKETSENIALWEGEKLTKEQASHISGIQTVFWTSDFKRVFREQALENRCIYLNANEHTRADVTIETRDARFVKWCRNAYPLHKYKRLGPILHDLRVTKSETEIMLIQRACNITEKAFRRVLGFVKPDVWEYEIEAEMIHDFLINRSRGPAYPTIVASGRNACVLHYVTNNCQCRDGDLILMDFGAEYANYASDVSRTIPVNGRFTKRQKQVYDAVLRIQKNAIQMLMPGNTFAEYNKAVGKMVEEELVLMGLIDRKEMEQQSDLAPLYKKYFMHGISHYMGLDVHDYGNRLRKFESGMVLTCEPGLYILKENLGIRLENNILITDDGPMDLTKNIPIEADEIESLMNGDTK